MQNGGLSVQRTVPASLFAIERLHWIQNLMFPEKCQTPISQQAWEYSGETELAHFFKIPTFQPKYYRAQIETV